MLLIEKSGIKRFKATQFMMAHWGVQMEVGEWFNVIDGGKTESCIYVDFDSYMDEHPSLPEIPIWNKPKDHPDMIRYRKEFDKYQEIMREIDKKYSMKIEHNQLVLKGEDHNNTFHFVFETKDELCEKYNIDKEKSFEWDCTTYMFNEYFDTKKFNRRLKIEEILGDD